VKKDERILLLLLVLGGIVFLNRRRIGSGAAQVATQISAGTTTVANAVIEQFKNMTLPRGVRNNNPGNLRITTIAWKGKVPNAQNSDRSFEQFVDYAGVPGHVWGIRAMFKDIYGDVMRDGQNTVRKLISTYAPPSENATQAYIAAVAKVLNKSPDAPIVTSDFPRLIAAIIAHENAGYRYPDTDIQKAISIA